MSRLPQWMFCIDSNDSHLPVWAPTNVKSVVDSKLDLSGR